jgi:hypothetical protein
MTAFKSKRASSDLSGYAQGLVIALLASFLVLVAPFGADKALAADPSRIIFNNGTCELTAAGYLGGGSQFNPFIISDADSLWEMADCDTAVDGSGSAVALFYISNNIDVSQAAYAPTSSPIGYSTSGDISFSAVLNGDNHMISNIAMSSTSYGVGLFAYLHSATISNLVISGSFVTTTWRANATTHSAGALAMYSNGDIYLSSVSNQADVTGFRKVGGLLGWSDGSVHLESSKNSGTISASREVGGLVGYAASDANITSSYNTGSVSADINAGGLVGYANANANITSSYNTGSVSAYYYAGGLVGRASNNASNNANIYSSYNTGKVTSADLYAGGLVGGFSYNANITSSYNTGSVSAGNEYAGGLVGFAGINSNITSSYNTGSVSAREHAGGLLGYANANANIYSSYNTGSVSAVVFNYAGGLVGQVSNNANIISSYNTGKVSADSYYAGGLVGQGHVVLIEASYNTGTVTAKDGRAGGLVNNSSRDSGITLSYNTGQVSGVLDVGGLIGEGLGTIYASFNSGAISGSATSTDIGGLIGDAGATTISNAYNTGAITTGGVDIGGLIGEGGSIFIENSYNTGVMSITGDYSGLVGPGDAFTATSVYTDQVASASSATSYSATALTDMKELTLYSGWDFDTIWGFGSCSDNNGLPMLRQLAQVGTYFGYSCGVDAAPAGNPVASNPAVYEGPTSYKLNTEMVPRGTSVVLTGNNMDLVTAARAGAVALEIQEQTATSLKLFVGQRVALGPATLYLTAINGTVYRLNAFTVIEGDASASYITDASASYITDASASYITDASASPTTKKVNAGSFKGYVALYALGYEGKRLSAKVGKDWVIVPSIPSQTNNLYRYVEFTGAGVNVAVRIYIDRVLVRTVYLTTK